MRTRTYLNYTFNGAPQIVKKIVSGPWPISRVLVATELEPAHVLSISSPSTRAQPVRRFRLNLVQQEGP